MSIIDSIIRIFRTDVPINAIDEETAHINEIVDWLVDNRYSFAEDSALEHLTIMVCRTVQGLKQPWAGESFLRGLRRRMAASGINATPEVVHIETPPAVETAVEIVPDLIYLSFGALRTATDGGKPLKLVLEKGTGSAQFDEYPLEASVRQYKLGRGIPTGTEPIPGRIIILENEPDRRLLEANQRVSVNQAVIFNDSGRWKILRYGNDSAVIRYERPDTIPATQSTLPYDSPLELHPGMKLYFGSRGVCFTVQTAE